MLKNWNDNIKTIILFIIKKIDFNLWQYGSSGYYIVPFKNKMYKVRVEDNVLKDPLYINQIVSWDEYEISLEG